MSPKDIFHLAVRILGLTFLYSGLSAACVVITHALSIVRGASSLDLMRDLSIVVSTLAVAWWLIGGAQWLTLRAYPEDAKDKSEV